MPGSDGAVQERQKRQLEAVAVILKTVCRTAVSLHIVKNDIKVIYFIEKFGIFLLE